MGLSLATLRAWGCRASCSVITVCSTVSPTHDKELEAASETLWCSRASLSSFRLLKWYLRSLCNVKGWAIW